ncbi:MAG: glycosyltransferase family 4 protein [Fibrobacteres bacterium]|nr:glycosyltransferase family 4 protein [Fibrobacterota bacterium]
MHDLAQGLSSNGHCVDLFVYKFSHELWGKAEDLKYKLVYIPLSLIPKPCRLVAMALYFRIKLRQYDVVNIHNTYVHHWMIGALLFNKRFPPVVWYCNEPRRETYYDVLEPEQFSEWEKLALRKYRIKCLGRLKVSWNNYKYKFLDRMALKHIDVVLANSNYSAGIIKKAFNITPVVCHAGAKESQQVPAKVEKKPYGLLVSRMVFHKNIEMVLMALAEIKNDLPDGFKLIIAGKGPDLVALTKKSEELCLAEYVEFKGFVTDEHLESLYAHADFFIYIPLHEPFGLTLIEAMKYGVPVIASSDGGAAEIVENNKDGFLVNPLDLKEVSLSLLEMITQASLRNKFGLNARAKVMNYFTLDKFVERFENIVESFLV